MWVEHANILEEKSYAQKGIEMKIQMHCFMIWKEGILVVFLWIRNVYPKWSKTEGDVDQRSPVIGDDL
jgi:hypothetical protein